MLAIFLHAGLSRGLYSTIEVSREKGELHDQNWTGERAADYRAATSPATTGLLNVTK